MPWWFDFDGARINPVCGDVEIFTGITLFSTPGHTPGHQSLLLESDAGRVAIAAQAAFTADEYLRGRLKASIRDGIERSTRGLAEEAANTANRPVAHRLASQAVVLASQHPRGEMGE